MNLGCSNFGTWQPHRPGGGVLAYIYLRRGKTLHGSEEWGKKWKKPCELGTRGEGGQGVVQAPEQVFLKGLQPWKTCAGAEEKCEKDGVAEKNQNVQTTTPPAPPHSVTEGAECTCCGNKGRRGVCWAWWRGAFSLTVFMAISWFCCYFPISKLVFNIYINCNKWS